MSSYEAVIGLEVHVHLSTASKLFCSCPNTFGDAPNSNVCEVCGGFPGALPVLNRKAVEYAAKMAMAVDAEINRNSVFARKNYFYPDMPFSYQISQYDEPLCEHGHVDIETSAGPRRIGITRIHMETDAGKNIHSQTENVSYLDLNRAGTPLIEIVSEPDMRTPEEAVLYLRELHSLVVNLGISNGNMEEGSFRCDANVSVRPKGQAGFGIRTETKNLNSFRHVQKAIEYEIARQEDILDDGGAVIQQTRLFDAERGITLPMRDKEDAEDYRYFPDPDLLPARISEEELALWRSQMPELPREKRARYLQEWNLPAPDADLLAGDPLLSGLLDKAAAIYAQPKKIANFILGPLLREINTNGTKRAANLRPEALAELARITDSGLISQKIAADIFSDVLDGAMPESFVRERGLVQVSDTAAIEEAVARIVTDNPKEAEAYRGGKKKLMGFFVGQVMRAMKGKGNPAVINEILAKYLG